MKYLKYTPITFFVLALLLTWLFPQFIRCYFIAFDDFQEIKQGVFVEKSTPKWQRDSLMSYTKKAQNRVKYFWGSREGKAKIIFCKNLNIYQKYAKTNEGAGFSVGTPLGSWIILNSEGLNVDVLAHEMCHDELMTNLGWWITKREIPTWFDEGLALMLDYRFVATQDSIQRYIDYRTELNYLSPLPIPLRELNTQKDFFGQSESFTRIAYFTSAVEVSRKISLKGRKEIFGIIETTRKKGKFEF